MTTEEMRLKIIDALSDQGIAVIDVPNAPGKLGLINLNMSEVWLITVEKAGLVVTGEASV